MKLHRETHTYQQLRRQQRLFGAVAITYAALTCYLAILGYMLAALICAALVVVPGAYAFERLTEVVERRRWEER